MLSTVIESKGIVKWRAMATTLSIDGHHDDAMYYDVLQWPAARASPSNFSKSFSSCYLILIVSAYFPPREELKSVCKRSKILIYLEHWMITFQNGNYPIHWFIRISSDTIEWMTKGRMWGTILISSCTLRPVILAKHTWFESVIINALLGLDIQPLS